MRRTACPALLVHPVRATLLPSEYQICLWCATEFSTQRWACVDCRMRIKQVLHEQHVLFYSLDGQPILSEYGPIPGSLTLREIKFAITPSFQTHACDLIQVLPLCNPYYPHELPFPEDLPIRVLGSQLQAFLTGNLQLQSVLRMPSIQVINLHSAILIALQSIRSTPYTYLLNLICESMKHYVL